MASSLPFDLKRNEPELVVPISPTPHELKNLSDIDDQEGLRFQVPFIFYYKNNPSMKGQDPIRVIKEALGRALVYYYPLAGRLKEGPNRKLMVDCTADGVLFIAANADVELEQIEDTIPPPSPFLDEFLYDVPGSDGIVGCPLLLIQVTRLRCGGFILALRLNHTMCDAFGMAQFLKTLAEMAQPQKLVPSITPVWQRELLNARNPPRITCTHREFQNKTTQQVTLLDPNNLVQKPFIFGPNELKAIRKHLPPQQTCSQFELLTACLWKCRTLSLQPNPEDVVLVSSLINVRGKHFDLGLPMGYYGNAFAYPAAVTKAELLCKNHLGYAVELVHKAKAEMMNNEDYIRSVADLMVIKGRPLYVVNWHFMVSDNRHVGYEEVDLGWGSPVFAGPAKAFPLISFYMKFKNNQIVVPMCLPVLTMERFEQELNKLIEKEPNGTRYHS
ncbi:hypothetical protein UlMin_042999 [Ulmus minor]